MGDGLYQPGLVFFIPYLVWTLGTAASWNGKSIESLSDFGTTASVAAILAANTYVGINTNYWTIITWIAARLNDAAMDHRIFVLLQRGFHHPVRRAYLLRKLGVPRLSVWRSCYELKFFQVLDNILYIRIWHPAKHSSVELLYILSRD